MNFVLNVVFQFYLILCGNQFTYRKQITIALVAVSITLALLPFCTTSLGLPTGFYVNCLLILVSGMANSVLSSSVFGLASFLPLKFIVAVSAGTAYAGLSMNVLRYIIIFISGVDDDSIETTIISSYVFFGIAVVILLIGIGLFQVMLF